MRSHPLVICTVALGLLMIVACGRDQTPTEPDPSPVVEPPVDDTPPPTVEEGVLEVAVGDSHICALDGAGEAFCWGRNTAGQAGGATGGAVLSPSAVSGGRSFVALIAGENHTCGLDADGQAWCWGGEGAKGTLGDGGSQDSATPVPVGGGHVFTSLSAAVDDHVCGIVAGGAAFCWGEAGLEGRLGDGASTTPQGTPVAVAGGIGFARIGTGLDHTCGVSTDGALYCWGNGYGTTPQLFDDGRTWGALSVGFDHTCALDEAGTAYCWGDDRSGQLGQGFATNGGATPERVSGSHVFVGLSGGRDHTCGVRDDGDVLCWGRADLGQIGDGTRGAACLDFDCRPSPVLVEGGHSFVRVVGGAEGNTCGINVDGGLLCWGSNAQGQLGLGPGSAVGPRTSPDDAIAGISFTGVSVGTGFACGVDDAQQGLCWGLNADGQLGTGDLASRPAPAAVTGGTNLIQISVGVRHTCALDVTQQASCWGYGLLGQLGIGYQSEERTPQSVVGSQLLSAIGVGRGHSCALDDTGAAWCWGDNRGGQVGDPSVVPNALEPVEVTGGLFFTEVAVGSDFSCGLEAAGTAQCWGRNTYGQLGNATTTGSDSPVMVQATNLASMSAGAAHACAVDVDGDASCWGFNQDGQLGDGTTADASTPVAVGGGHTFVAVQAGSAHSCGIDDAGALLCWGNNQWGQLGDGTTTNRPLPTPVATGLKFEEVGLSWTSTCARTGEGDVYCWGVNTSGQLGGGPESRSLVPVAVLPF